MDNTVGSLTDYQKSVIKGSLLGDGYVRRMPGRKNAFLEVNHSFQQKEYVDWKYQVLCSVAGSAPKPRRGNGARIAYRFYTKQDIFFSNMLDMYYSNTEKIIPRNIRLDPVSIAVWYMDDGSRCRDSDVYFNTQQFDEESQNRLLLALEHVGVFGTLNKDKEYKRIRILKRSIPKLFTLIAPHIIPSMQYKIHCTVMTP